MLPFQNWQTLWVLNILIVLHASWTHSIRRFCQSSLSYFFFRHWHYKCALISASAQPPWSWLRVLIPRFSNFVVVKLWSSSTGAGGSDYCKWTCSLYSNSGIDRIDFVQNCIAFTLLVCPWSQIPGLINVLGWWVSHPHFQCLLAQCSNYEVLDCLRQMYTSLLFGIVLIFMNKCRNDWSPQNKEVWLGWIFLPRCLFTPSPWSYCWWLNLTFNFSTCQF